MGTHPIFESDFDCLTEKKMSGKDVQNEEKSKEAEAMMPPVAPPSYESAVDAKQNIVNSTTHQQPTVNVGETTVIITNQTRQEKPHLFDVGATHYMAWFCYTLFCQSCAMYSMAGKLGEKCRIHYIIVFVLLSLALLMREFSEQVIVNWDYFMSESDFNEDFNQDDLYYWANAWSISNVCNAILMLTMIILAIQQRRRFSNVTKNGESCGISILAAWCCNPCSYGQMGATEIQTV